jgi:hypothetical protein
MPEPENGHQRKIATLLPIFAAVAVVAIILALIYVGNRLETIEDQLEDGLRFRPPQAAPAPLADSASTAVSKEVYVPAYSHIYSRSGTAFLLEVTLSVRNTDPRRPIRINRVLYFDTEGRQIRELTEGPITLGPLETASYLVEKQDIEGGSGANFIVDWSSDGEVNSPIIESVMVSVDSTHNLSFTSRGEPIERILP